MPFRFPAGETAAGLVRRLRQNGWWGQIVGPHGSGKSALLATLIPAIEEAGRHAFLVELHDAQRRLPLRLRHTPGPDSSTVLIVDGYEQLSRWQRFRVKRFCRCNGLGLLVTAHASVCLPDLCKTAPDLPLAQQIVAQLQAEYPPHVTPDDVARRFAHHAGDLRELLFDLYDLYEQRRGT